MEKPMQAKESVLGMITAVVCGLLLVAFIALYETNRNAHDRFDRSFKALKERIDQQAPCEDHIPEPGKPCNGEAKLVMEWANAVCRCNPEPRLKLHLPK